MELTTKIPLPKSSIRIGYTNHLMFAGSCFAENISRFFSDAKFSCFANPSGIVYNPLSLSSMVHNVLSGRTYTGADFFQEGNRYCCFDFHGDYARQELHEAVQTANLQLHQSREYLLKTDVFFITLGTAFVYFIEGTSDAVSNCHRQPSALFYRRRISVAEIVEALSAVVEEVTAVNPEIRFVFTVSPIRHIRDGIHDNTLSKSALHLAIDEVVGKYGNCEYFPSYEIVMDELRDYRFYADDMVHVSALAEKIIWHQIQQTYMTEATRQQVARIEKFMASVHHRIQDPDSPQTEAFCQKNLSLAFALEDDIQGLDLSDEKKYFKSFIKVC